MTPTSVCPQSVLFDLDGVIVDTEPEYTKFWQTIGQKYFPHLPTFATDIKGSALTEIFRKYFPEEADRKIVQHQLLDFEETMPYPLVPGVMDFVLSLRDAHIPTAIVTSSDKAKMKALQMAHPTLPDCFTAVYTAEDSPVSKPAPDCYILAAQRLNADIRHSIVFEDSHNGLLAAHRSGAKVVGLTTSLSADKVSELSHWQIADFRNVDTATLFKRLFENL